MQPLIWLGILALLLVVEAITAGLTTIWFAGGALVAAIACYAGANLTVQILLFLCVSLVLLIFTRPLAMKYFNKETIQTNANSNHIYKIWILSYRTYRTDKYCFFSLFVMFSDLIHHFNCHRMKYFCIVFHNNYRKLRSITH